MGLGALALAFMLNSFTTSSPKKEGTQEMYYFQRVNNSWTQVESEDDLVDCGGSTELCGAISDQIANGQPAGNVTELFRD